MTQQNAFEWTPIYTDRLILRRPEAEDLYSAMRIHIDSPSEVHVRESGTVTPATSVGRFRSMREHWDRHGFGVWVAAAREAPGTVLGFTGLSHRWVYKRSVLNFSCRYSPEAWGWGFAKEGAQQAINHAAAFLPELPVVAHTNPSSLEFRRTAMSVGLTRRPKLDIDHGPLIDIYLTLNW